MNEHPDHTCPDRCADTAGTSGGIIRTGLARPEIIGETIDCGPLPTRADTTRTRPDTDTTDSCPGVRVEYRARVPRHQLGAAIAEVFGHISAAQSTTTYTPEPSDAERPDAPRRELTEALGHLSTKATAAYTPDTVRTAADHDVRRAQTGAAINAAFDVPAYLSHTGHPDTTRPDTVRAPEPASLLGQVTKAMTAVMQQRVDDQVEATVAEHCAVVAAAALGHVADILPPTGYAHVSGHCPACGRTALFLGDGEYVTCAHLECPRPDAAADLLDHPPFRTRTGCNDCPTEGTTTT